MTLREAVKVPRWQALVEPGVEPGLSDCKVRVSILML